LIALIPARGGSKRLPGKNTKVLGGKPLISWTIDAARESGLFSTVIVSTDDEKIAEESVRSGAEVHGLRPSYLSTDTASSVDVALYVLNKYEEDNGVKVDGFVLLQPTSPFRSAATIRRGVELLNAFNWQRPVVSVSQAESNPAWCFVEHSDLIEPVLGWDSLKGRSQDLNTVWALNGAFYGISPTLLKDAKSFLNPHTILLKMDSYEESLDIDTESDWAVAEYIISRRS